MLVILWLDQRIHSWGLAEFVGAYLCHRFYAEWIIGSGPMMKNIGFLMSFPHLRVLRRRKILALSTPYKKPHKHNPLLAIYAAY